MQNATIRPESDWSIVNRGFVSGFTIDRSWAAAHASIDIRRFEWTGRASGEIVPGRHYLDFSLLADRRRSVLRTDAWEGPQCSGDVLYLPPGHSCWGEPALEKRHMLCLGIAQPFFADLFEDDAVLRGALPRADLQSGRMRQFLNTIARELTAPAFASDTLIESCLIGLAVELARLVERRADVSTGGGSTGGGDERQARRIVAYIRENLASSLSVSEIARECGMSTRSVNRVFKASTGVSIGEYIARSRIELAKELLASDDFRVKEVSWRCGFRSASAFSAAFRAATRMTPRAFRHSPTSLQ